MRTLVLGLCFFCASTITFSVPQQRHETASPAKRLPLLVSTSQNTQHVSCWKKSQRSTHSYLVRSPILVSSDLLHRAYVEVEATAFEPTDVATYVGSLC